MKRVEILKMKVINLKEYAAHKEMQKILKKLYEIGGEVYAAGNLIEQEGYENFKKLIEGLDAHHDPMMKGTSNDE